MRKYCLLLILLLTTSVAYTQTYITHATIINVNTGKTDADQTIVIVNDRIAGTGPSK